MHGPDEPSALASQSEALGSADETGSLPENFAFTGGKAGADQRRVLADPDLMRWLRSLHSELSARISAARVELTFDRDSTETVLEITLHTSLEPDAAEGALAAFLPGWMSFNRPPAWLDDITIGLAS